MDFIEKVKNLSTRITNQMEISQTFVMTCVVLLTLTFVGCGTADWRWETATFIAEGSYVVPNLPKSELATIKIDTTGHWIQHVDVVILRIMGKVALWKKVEDNDTDSVDEIFVMPGKQDMSIQIVHKSYEEGVEQNVYVKSKFFAAVKAGGIYLIKGDYTHNTEADFSFELIDTANDKVISKSNMLSKSKFYRQKSGNFIYEHTEEF